MRRPRGRLWGGCRGQPHRQRSALMAKVGRRDTKPELDLRRELHSLGLRYRLHRKNLPGTPDLTFPRFRPTVFVNGCFWHRHEGCRLSALPTTNFGFWKQKLEGNVGRDRTNFQALQELGWRVVVVWGCELNTEARATSAPRRPAIPATWGTRRNYLVTRTGI